MKTLTFIGFALFLAGILLFLGQLWFQFFPAVIFSKLMITTGALFLIVFVANFLIREHRLTQKINHGDRLE